nr:ribonuclease H-like domain-containing protein [Tanacetum cinerariifolium]
MTSQSAFSFPDLLSSSTQQATFTSFSPGLTYITSEPVTNSQPNPQTSNNFQNQQFQQYHTATLSSNNAKFPYLKKKEYEMWSLPEDHMADFHHLDDAREIWLAVKARFSGNKESKKMRKTMLKQEFLEFCVSKEEGLHKGYDRSLEIDVKGGSSYGSKGTTVAPTHSTFIGAASTNTKMVIIKDVLHLFVAKNEPTQQLAYEDFEQVDQIEMEELDIKWQMDMLSLRINKFQKKAGRKINFNNKDPTRFDRRKARKVKTEEPKAMVSVDSMLNWNEHEAKNKTKEGEQVYGLMAGFKSNFANHAGNAAGSVYDVVAEFAMMGISPKVQTCPFGCDSKLSELKKNYDHLEKLYNDSFIQVQAYKNTVKTLELQKDWYHKTQLALEEKVKILFANLENTTNTLKYSKTLYHQAKIENKEWEVKLTESLARFDKWKESSKNLAKLIYSSMSTRTKLGLGFKEYIGLDEAFDLSTPSVFDPEPENREVKSLYESPKTNDSFSTVDVKILPKSDVKDPSPTNGFPSCSFKENVKPPRNLCNKSRIADRILCKNNFVRTKTCFVYGSKSHLIKDCDVYDNVENFPSVVSNAASVPAGSRNSLASISAGRSILAASKNRPASIHVGRHIHTGRFNKPAPFPTGRSVPTGWTNHAARPFLYFDNVYWAGIYDHMSMNKGRWGSTVKSSAELASPEQTATGKDISNPFMAVMICQKSLGYFNSPMIQVLRVGLVINLPGYIVPTGRVMVPTGRYIVPTGRVIVTTGRYVVPTDSAHMVAASKVSILKPGEFKIWRMRINQYIQMADYAFWEVIENDAALPRIQVVESVTTVMPITSVKDKAQRRLEVKEKSTLMMGIPNKHQLNFNSIKDSKQLLESVEKRFGRNAATKKTQRNLLKQQYENFTASNLEVVNTANGVSTANNQVNAAYSSNTDNLSDVVVYAFLASQPNSPQLVHEDLEQIHSDDIKEIDLRWQMAMLTMMARRRGDTLLGRYEYYNAVPPPYTGNFIPPKPDLSYTGLDEFVVKLVVENKSSEEETKAVRKITNALIIKEWVSDDEEENVTQHKTVKKIVRPSIVKK